MNKLNAQQGCRWIAGGALLMLAGLAQAQYVWVDANGHKQISDQAPPSSVPASKILRAPTRAAAAQAQEEAAAKPAAPAVSLNKSLAERDAESRKRKLDKDAADAKADAVAAEQARKQANCASARTNQAQLATGRRMRYATGDRAVVDANARQAEQAKVDQALADCN